ncbi:MAG: D-sedoheptulose-7-phosphate isomerase [Rhodanobacteraceae bacterium]
MNIRTIFAEHAAVMGAASALWPSLEEAIAMLRASLAAGHKVLACGNGGSAASAQHFVAELVCRFHDDRHALAAVALTADAATLTAIGNDYGYARVFARQVEALGRPGDVLVAISTSGNSANVIDAVRTARACGCKVIALTGAGGGAIAREVDVAVCVPSAVTARIQEVHDVCIHAIAQALEEGLDD